jgi:CubicO group peptidase (beta-lactamase class C family)
MKSLSTSLACAAILCPLTLANVGAQTGASPLIGIWGTSISFGQSIRGDLTIVGARNANALTARIRGYEVPVTRRGDSLSFTLPGDLGKFRGEIDRSTGNIRGHWVQPPMVVSGVPYASPVTLQSIAGAWRGEVVPLEDRFTLFARIDRSTDGRLFAVFRNPERNLRGGSQRFLVSMEGLTVHFRDSTNSRNSFDAAYDSAQKLLTFTYPQLGRTLDLERVTTPRATVFFPRAGESVRYAYRPPLIESDGWKVGRLDAEGLDAAKISGLVQSIIDIDPAVPSAPLVHSLLIARHGKLLLEEYFFGYDGNEAHDLRSASKTFASVLAGIAIDRGAPFNIHTPVLSLFPEYTNVANLDDRKRRITVENLMTMSTGLACDENDNDSPGNENTMQSQTAQSDWYKFILDLPMVHSPGETYAYCSGTVNLLGGVVRNTTHMWLPDFFQKYVADPLDMRRYYMNLGPTGEGYFGGGLRLRPRDLLKLGQLYLDGGRWNGRRVVSANWVAQSVSPQIKTGAESADGYNWHLNTLHAGGKSYKEYEANGNGGQFLIVLPELDIAVVFTAGNYNSYGVWRKFRDEMVPQFVIEAVNRN